MRTILKLLVTCLLVSVTVSSAWADRDHDHGRGNDDHRYGYDNHRGYDRHYNAGPRYYHGYYNRYYVEPPIIVQRQVYVRPRPPVVIYAPEQPYVRVRCSNTAAITGTIIGGVAGGLIGNQFSHHHRFAPTLGGSLIGALLGGEIGAANETCAAEALEYARPNTQVVWENDDSSYVVQPVRTYQDAGQYCREYQTRVNVGGNVQQSYGTACRQPDGSWHIVN